MSHAFSKWRSSKIFQQFRMKTLLLVYTTLIFLTISGVVFATLHVLIQVAHSFLIHSSEVIFAKKTRAQLHNHQHFQVNLLNLYLQSIFKSIWVNQKFMLRHQNIGISPEFPKFNMMVDPLLPYIENGSLSQSIMCYSNFSADYEIEEWQLQYKFLDFLAAIQPLMNSFDQSGSNLYYGSFAKSPRSVFAFPCMIQGPNVPKVYIPETRPWYILAKEQFELKKQKCYQLSYSVTPPYHFANGDLLLGFSLTYPLVDQNCNFIGAIAHDISNQNLKRITSHLNTNEVSFFLLSNTGLFIIQNFTLTEPDNETYFFNESKTGFTLDDWNQLNSQNPISNCLQIDLRGVICRRNSLYKRNFFILPQFLPSKGLISVLLVSTDRFQRQQGYTFSVLAGMIDDYYELALYMVIFVLLGTLLLIKLANRKIFEPIQRLGEIFSLQHHNNSSFQKQVFQKSLFDIYMQSWIPSVFEKLFQKSRQLIENLNRIGLSKGEQPHLIEHFQWPKQYHQGKFDRRIFNQIRNLASRIEVANELLPPSPAQKRKFSEMLEKIGSTGSEGFYF